MHGLGNDFILVDCRETQLIDPAGFARSICNRHTGVGADGLILAVESDKADIGMLIFNSDGSQAEMCGNGIRCFAKYAYDQRMITYGDFTVDTLAGIMAPELVFGIDGSVDSVVVDMGKPVLEPSRIPATTENESFINVPLDTEYGRFYVSAVRIGVPHAVVFVDEFKELSIEEAGKAIENHPSFPMKTNVNFVKVDSRRQIQVRTWERGAGKTLACGTGCCSSVVVSSILGNTDREVTVKVLLGELGIRWDVSDNIYMKGPAEFVCSGSWPYRQNYPMQT